LAWKVLQEEQEVNLPCNPGQHCGQLPLSWHLLFLSPSSFFCYFSVYCFIVVAQLPPSNVVMLDVDGERATNALLDNTLRYNPLLFPFSAVPRLSSPSNRAEEGGG
jgi:hypothetical protein